MSSADLVLLHAPSVFDFREEAILFGPISDLVPSSPVFEMYPIGFTTIAEYLERHGLRVRIVNLALRMLQDLHLDARRLLARLDAAVFGIDLHWLPHAHGSLAVAQILKELHPNRPVLFGGFSATYFCQELIRRPEVDFILRGDSTEGPALELVRYVCSGGKARPALGSADARRLAAVANLVWKDDEGAAHVNPLTYSPENLDDLLIDYRYVVRSVLRYRDLANFLPFRRWMRYPITAALSVRGCRYNCVTCGGSCDAYRRLHGRQRPAYRNPEQLAEDIRRISAFSDGPVFVLGDIRQPGEEYADRFLEAIAGHNKPVILELFDVGGPEFFGRVSRSLSNFVVEVSLESHDDEVRKAFGRPYTRNAIERAFTAALDAGCQRLDVFFMVGLAKQTYASVMATADYCEELMRRFNSHGDKRLAPFISPLAPFVDPGSRAFEDPGKYGYRLRWKTLEEHRQALSSPSWKYALNYETEWMDRDAIVEATYEAGLRLNRAKTELGMVEESVGEATEQRIRRAMDLSRQIDQLMAVPDAKERRARLQGLKQEIGTSNLSTVCNKTELELPLRRGQGVKWFRGARLALREVLRGTRRAKD